MKINNFNVKSMRLPGYIILLLSLTSFFLVSCGPFKPKKVDLREIPGDPKGKRERNIREGRGFRMMGALEGGGGGTFQFASSNPMWRASLELLEFTPLSNVDYSGGIIISDWFSENSDQDPIKISIRFLSNEIRADGLKVIIHKKICKKNDLSNCKVIQESSTLGQEIKLAILKKATILSKEGFSKHQKEYTEEGPGRDSPAKKSKF